ncbi:MAG: hypothetical protein BM557_11275 [Flavobacterium sp. MedPE-SWcel]|uniref:hypothetical protein n=1 Tax=uncultured Flavobacterium sp. TaxID=165435 RepID=UPI00091FAD75|nr:hypothetical protein [uncultured Flavobacterium sp.]OIQ15418.1 MAG: hypothetical protein BM557_11275 [Flavobacterium sp. MedPE-SWcel]
MLLKTIRELEQWMKENCFNFDSYSINGNFIYEGFGIDNSGGLFIWYYTERGERDNLKYFVTESEATIYAYNQIKADKWAKAHCIGFTQNKMKSIELGNKLNEMNIAFFQDEIPYNGKHLFSYRTFVFGCDVRKVIGLKQEYPSE